MNPETTTVTLSGVVMAVVIGLFKAGEFLLARRKPSVPEMFSEIKKEFVTNGGSTFKDDIQSIKSELSGMKSGFTSEISDLKDGVLSESKQIKQGLSELFESHLAHVARSKADRDLLPYGVYECNEKGECTWVNAQWVKWAGIERSTAFGNGWLAGIHVDDRARVRENWMQCMAENRLFEMRYRMATGIEVLSFAQPLIAKDKPLGWYGKIELAVEPPRKTVLQPDLTTSGRTRVKKVGVK